MIPVDPGELYGVHHFFGVGQLEVEPLEARVDHSQPEHPITTRWRLSGKERGLLFDGADLFLTIQTFGNPVQPIALWIEGDEHSE